MKIKTQWMLAHAIHALFWTIALILFLSLFAGEAKAASRVQVTRLVDDTYKTNTGLIVFTERCYQFSYNQDAVLVWMGDYYADNVLIFFQPEATCKVLKVTKIRKD